MRSYFPTDARLPEAIPFIGQCFNRPLWFLFKEGEMAFVLRNIAGDAECGTDGVAIADARFGVFDVGAPARGHQEDGNALPVPGLLGKSLSKRPKPLDESWFWSGCFVGRFCLSDT